ncbi:hypothetical protein E2C01_099876 [Portunus trituberculatus]|uniref:Uncharacterized protein n=1 Tax=Portunus trituberculatus TaxID=210409 RepID=A0A5B7K1H3_PORTR|nr:hypothetical protein [Portunus trituberculatus]
MHPSTSPPHHFLELLYTSSFPPPTPCAPSRQENPKRLEAGWLEASGNTKICSLIFPLVTTHPELQVKEGPLPRLLLWCLA